MEKTFLGYLNNWEKQVKDRNDLNRTEKLKLLLSLETRQGLHITGMFIVKIVRVIIIIVL